MPHVSRHLALAMLIGFSAKSSALTIVPTFSAGVGSDLQAYAQTAIQNISNIFTGTDITVNVTFQSMNSGLGQSISSTVATGYSNFRSALAATTTTAIGTLAVANLPIQTANPVTNNESSLSIQLTTANARALGLVDPPGSSVDGTVSINTGAGSFDYVSVVEHELNEVLGLGSALSVGASALPHFTTPEDLFRYQADGTRSFSLSSSEVAFFSVDGNVNLGTTPQFNQDGAGDYGDWCSHTPADCATFGYFVQNAYATRNRTIPYGTPEINALEAIGYNVAAVPLPPAAFLLGSAFVTLFLRPRRRKLAD